MPTSILLSNIIKSPDFAQLRNDSTAALTNMLELVFLSGIGVGTQIMPILELDDFNGSSLNSKLFFLPTFQIIFF